MMHVGSLGAFVALLAVQTVLCYHEIPSSPLFLVEQKSSSATSNASFDLGLLDSTSLDHGDDIFRRQTRRCVNPGYSPCPNGVQCSPPGFFCCPGKSFSCPDGSRCCPLGDRNCAPPGGQCCEARGSCLAGEKCCPPSENPSLPCAPVDSVCCDDGYCPSGSTCCQGEGRCARPGHICCPKEISCPADGQCCEDDDGPYCADKCLPTIIFPNLEGWSEEIFENMARGIKKVSGGKSTAVLTWDGGRGRSSRRANARRRRQSGCGGRTVCPPGYNCDEFPFASTLEGGSGANIRCVPKDLNDWQGIYWSSWLAEAKARGLIKTGGQFRVKLKYFDVDGVTKRSLEKRASPVLSSSNNVTVLSSSAFGNFSNGTNAVIVPLTPDPEYGYTGRYTVDYSITGGALSSGYIMDDSGEPYEVLANLADGKSSTTSFDIDDEGSGNVWLLGWTKSEAPEIKYSVKAPPAPTTSVAQSTWSSSSAPEATESAATTENPQPPNGAPSLRIWTVGWIGSVGISVVFAGSWLY